MKQVSIGASIGEGFRRFYRWSGLRCLFKGHKKGEPVIEWGDDVEYCTICGTTLSRHLSLMQFLEKDKESVMIKKFLRKEAYHKKRSAMRKKSGKSPPKPEPKFKNRWQKIGHEMEEKP